MAHVTFIHGIANKPAPDALLQIWLRALANDDTGKPLSLDTEGVGSNLVYWADVLYPAPDADLAAHESRLESLPVHVDASGDATMPEGVSAESRAFIRAIRSHLTTMDDAEIERDPAPDPSKVGLERIWLPWALKKKIMAATLRDVHHYLFDVTFTPRPTGPTYQVQEEIRKRFLAGLRAAQGERPHVVVSHSMGTVIAYDCLKNVPDCPAVDGLITLGSPLGLDEIQDKVAAGIVAAARFPTDRLNGEWVNGFDRLDVVCGLDPTLGNDFRGTGGRQVTDVEVFNEGSWKHSATKYYRQPEVRKALRRLLAI